MGGIDTVDLGGLSGRKATAVCPQVPLVQLEVWLPIRTIFRKRVKFHTLCTFGAYASRIDDPYLIENGRLCPD